ncbi:MAG: hypothetical protein RL095_4131 [Verrucomicrobiota bacterium]|jgi:hypothetical protein
MPESLDQELRRQARQEPLPDSSALLAKLGPELRRSPQAARPALSAWKHLLPIAAAAALLLFFRPSTPLVATPPPVQIAAVAPETQAALSQLSQLSFDNLLQRSEELPRSALDQQLQLLKQDFQTLLPAGSELLLTTN